MGVSPWCNSTAHPDHPARRDPARLGPDRSPGPGPGPDRTTVLYDKPGLAPVYVNLVKPGPAPAPVLKKY